MTAPGNAINGSTVTLSAGVPTMGVASMAHARAMRFLSFDRGEAGDGVHTLEAVAATRAEQHAAVMAEVQQVLEWAERHFPHSHGPVDDGHHWQHDLQVTVEGLVWHSVTLTLSASDAFVAEFMPVFGAAAEN